MRYVHRAIEPTLLRAARAFPAVVLTGPRRAAILALWPMSSGESPRVSTLTGGYPEALANPRAASLWFSSYVQTYLERDVRSISAINDLPAFRRFLALVASRHGQLLNKSDLAAPLGMSIPGVGRWLDILEMTSQIIVVPPLQARGRSRGPRPTGEGHHDGARVRAGTEPGSLSRAGAGSHGDSME